MAFSRQCPPGAVVGGAKHEVSGPAQSGRYGKLTQGLRGLWLPWLRVQPLGLVTGIVRSWLSPALGCGPVAPSAVLVGA